MYYFSATQKLQSSFLPCKWYQIHTTLVAAASGCLPLLNFSGKGWCTKLRDEILSYVVRDQLFDVVILAADWGGVEALALKQTINQLLENDIFVVVVGVGPKFSESIPHKIIRSAMHKNKVPTQTEPINQIMALNFEAEFLSLYDSDTVQFVNYYNSFCDGLAIWLIEMEFVIF